MEPAAKRPVSGIMRTQFASLREDDRLDLVDQVMDLGRVRHLPVLDAGGRPVGIVSNRDLLEASLTNILDFGPKERRTFLHSIDVKEVMRRPVETVDDSTPLGVAAARMVRHKIGCLPVVDATGVMVGLITEIDLLAAAYLSEPANAPEPVKEGR
jgi:CBS domain-containing protein